MVRIPPRTATDSYLARMGLELDIVFDADPGELADGHHVVAHGGEPQPVPGEQVLTEAELHYEFVPGLTDAKAHGSGGLA